MVAINRKIQIVRKAQGQTLEEVGKAIGMTKGNLSRIEKGEVKLSFQKLELWLRHFHMSLEELMSFENPLERAAKPTHLGLEDPSLIMAEHKNKMMQANIEEFLWHLVQRLREIAKKEGAKDPDEEAFKKLWAIGRIDKLLNKDHFPPDHMLLVRYHEFLKKGPEKEGSIAKYLDHRKGTDESLFK